MKRFFIIIGLILFSCFTFSQNGLENIIVEKYYVSGTNDISIDASGQKLPVNSVTYRIYVDMLPGYKFQAAFGIPGHELKIETTTTFFNHPKGKMIPNLIRLEDLNDNTLALDSWLSVGAACEAHYGVLKEEDDTIKNTFKSLNKFLQNKSSDAGISVTDKDGLKFSFYKLPRVTFFGIDSIAKIFDNNIIGSKFTTTNGSWACLNGAIGTDSLTNKVLIAQITTDGELSFELNIQIGTPYGGVQQYVAKNAESDKIYFEGLTYSSMEFNKSKKNKSFNK